MSAYDPVHLSTADYNDNPFDHAQEPPKQTDFHFPNPSDSALTTKAVPPPSSGGSSNEADPRFNYGSSGCRDVGFVILFVIHLIGMVVIAATYGSAAVNDAKSQHDQATTTMTSSGTQTTQTGNQNLDANLMLTILVVASVISGGFSVFWLGMMQKYSKTIIKTSMMVTVGMAVGVGILSILFGSLLMGIIYLVFAAFIGFCFWTWRDRIPFASAILHSSVQSIKDNNGPVYVAYVLGFVKIGWFAFWAFVYTSIYFDANKYDANGNAHTTNTDNLLIVFSLFSLYWVSTTLKNIGHVTTSGTTASWWFTPALTSPTRPAFVRAVTTSLGSIMFASLLVALIRTVRFLLHSARDRAAACVDCILACIEGLLKFFNKYALAIVAIYGYSFVDAARETKALFGHKLLDVIINDDMSGMVLGMGALLGGLSSGIVCGCWAKLAGMDGWVFVAVLAFFVGLLMATLFMSVIESSVATTFVSWAMDPAALQRNRPVEFGEIAQASGGRYAAMGQRQQV